MTALRVHVRAAVGDAELSADRGGACFPSVTWEPGAQTLSIGWGSGWDNLQLRIWLSAAEAAELWSRLRESYPPAAPRRRWRTQTGGRA